jgi:HEPN domain-containing protein
MADEAQKRKHLAALLDDVADDLEMAELGAGSGNRLAIFHVQQAAEKLTRAVRAHRDLVSTKSHFIEELIDGNAGGGIPKPLPDGDPWREKLRPLIPLSNYATTFRYPSDGGKRKPGPPAEELNSSIKRIRELLAEAKEEFLNA